MTETRDPGREDPLDYRVRSRAHGHSRIGRPYRRVRRWARHTPNGEIAVAVMAVGVALIFVALIVALVVL